MVKGISYLILALSLLACKAKKEVQTEQATEEVKAADTHLQEPEQSEADIHLLRSQQKLPDSLFARIQRTACFGRCPIYTLSVYESGYVDYVGEKWVEREGHFKAKVEKGKLDQLMEKAKAVNYFEFNHKYDSKYVTDLPSTITTVKGENGFHIVVNRYEAPEAHTRFAQEFDALFKGLEWQKVPIE